MPGLTASSARSEACFSLSDPISSPRTTTPSYDWVSRSLSAGGCKEIGLLPMPSYCNGRQERLATGGGRKRTNGGLRCWRRGGWPAGGWTTTAGAVPSLSSYAFSSPSRAGRFPCTFQTASIYRVLSHFKWAAAPAHDSRDPWSFSTLGYKDDDDDARYYLMPHMSATKAFRLEPRGWNPLQTRLRLLSNSRAPS